LPAKRKRKARYRNSGLFVGAPWLYRCVVGAIALVELFKKQNTTIGGHLQAFIAGTTRPD